MTEVTISRELLERIDETAICDGTDVTISDDLFTELVAALSVPAQQQEPIGYVAGHYAGRAVIRPVNDALVFPNNMAVYAKPSPAPADALDAERYRWLRERLQIRFMEAVSGIKKEGITTRIGHCFLDADRIPGSGYLDQSKFQAECAALDAAIDAALAAAKESRHD
jgi:hypothetical protein